MKTTRKPHVFKKNVIEIMLTAAMALIILIGIAPGTSIKAQAAEKNLSDYTVGEALPKGATLSWDTEGSDFNLYLQDEGYRDEGEVQEDSYLQICEKISVSSDGLLDDGFDNRFEPYDVNASRVVDTWYVSEIDVEYKSITLTGAKNPTKLFLPEYKVGEAVTQADFVKWNENQSYFTLILKGGTYKVGDSAVACDCLAKKAWLISVYEDGVMECNYIFDNNNQVEEFKAYDSVLKQDSNTWYVDSVDMDNMTVTLTGTAPN